MKKLFPLFLCLIIIFASCSADSDDDGNRTNTQEMIIGKWNFAKMVYDDGQVDLYTDCDEFPFLNFFNDGTVVRGYCSIPEESGEYLVTGNLLELEHLDPFGKTLRMSADIEIITSEEMKLEVEEGYVWGKSVTIFLKKAN